MEEQEESRGARAGKRQGPAISSLDMVVTLVAVVVVLAGLSFSLIFPPDSPDAPVTDEGQRVPAAAIPPPATAADPVVPEGGEVLVPPLAMEAERQSAQLVCQALIGTTELTALAYNIKSARAGSLERLLGVMQRSGAEVLLLQEVDNRRRSTGSVDQAAWFAERLGGWNSAFGRNVTFGDGLYGTAVVSKYPIVSSVNTPLPNIGRAQPRGLLHVVIDVEGVEVSLYSTHLDNTSANIRTQQASRISSMLAADPRPKLLGGDMNTWPGSGPERILTSRLSDSFVVAGSGSGPTHPASRPRTRIDYLLYGGPDLTATSSSVMPEGGSDHLPVRSVFTLGGIKTEKCSDGATSKKSKKGGESEGPAPEEAGTPQ
ncbi:endonuclease/exonuclease/phosphatase family protein [Nocardioides sp. LHD-245]|uniref:endonuclease/exonuclease/phosphatase family protein n=1 Tax=Nocardioides sp. LHD-245 TaxID=3051387 RepID=UPI0027E10981|nr:endonuclease/exonuclease/phosphatase family protein [Nocardioides sp. LHD-245]